MRSAAAGLLAESDPLSFPERMSLLAHRARALSGPGELDAVLSDLYHRVGRRADLDLDRSPLADAGRRLSGVAGCTRQAAGLLAAALARYGAKVGWPAAWQALVRSHRNHHVPDVRAAALEIVMAPE